MSNEVEQAKKVLAKHAALIKSLTEVYNDSNVLVAKLRTENGKVTVVFNDVSGRFPDSRNYSHSFLATTVDKVLKAAKKYQKYIDKNGVPNE